MSIGKKQAPKVEFQHLDASRGATMQPL